VREKKEYTKRKRERKKEREREREREKKKEKRKKEKERERFFRLFRLNCLAFTLLVLLETQVFLCAPLPVNLLL